MKKETIIVLLSILFYAGHSQTPLVIEGQTYTNINPSWSGVIISHIVPTLLTFKNNSITSVNSNGYMLQSGDDSYIEASANNLDNSLISGNMFDWNGPPGTTLCHGIMAGYNLNYTIRYNYIDGPFYGIVNEGGYNNGRSMVNTGGGINYNIIKNCPVPIITMGYKNVYIYNNTFYYNLSSGFDYGFIRISSSNGTTIPAPSENVKIKNNIFYSATNRIAIYVTDNDGLIGLECDYNIYYWESTSGNKPIFNINGSNRTWEEWKALGYDTHSIIINPSFIDMEAFIPRARLEYGTALGEVFNDGLAINSVWEVGKNPNTIKQGINWQTGAKIYESIYINPSPVFVSSVIENTTPSRLQMIYDIPLANIVPSLSAFSVSVNSAIRNIISVNITGNSVILTLASPVVYGDVITVAYTKPSINPLQSNSGGQALSIDAVSVTNNVEPLNLLYINSVIENDTPSELEMIYSTTLANIVPASSAFSVSVNSVGRNIISIAISGTKVILNLASPVVYDDVITVEYNKPSINPLQSASGEQAESLNSQSVKNNCLIPTYNQAPIVSIILPDDSVSFQSPATISIEAVASDPDGQISKVEFLHDNISLGEKSMNPYSYSWKDVTEGTYSITAIATDNLNAFTKSDPVVIFVTLKTESPNQLNLFPNPNDGRFSIRLDSSLADDQKDIAILNLEGKIVCSLKMAEGEKSKDFDFSSFASGLYVLLLTCNNTAIITKVLIRN